MTPEDRELDLGVFGGENLTLFRLATARYANLSGVGAALYPGRWNRLGQEALYTSTEISTPVLERLAHTPKGTIPKNLAMMHIALRGNWQVFEDSIIDRQDRASIRLCKTLAEARRAFANPFDLSLHFAIALPSVIIPAWDVVLYTGMQGFWNHVSLQVLEPFEFDARLFPDTAM